MMKSKLFLLINCLFFSSIVLMGCPSSSTSNSGGDDSGGTAIASLDSTTIEQGGNRTPDILTINYTSNGNTDDVTFTATTALGGTQVFSSDGSNSCTVSGGSGSCTMTVVPDFLATTGQNYIEITASSDDVTVTSAPLLFTVTNRSSDNTANIGWMYLSGNDNNEDHVYHCPLSSDGDTDGCTIANTNVTFDSQPTHIAFHTAKNGETYAYLTDGVDNIIHYCPVDSTTGDLGTCLEETINNFIGSMYDIAFYTAPDGTGYAYVNAINGDSNDEEIYYCQVGGDGSLNDCLVATAANDISNKFAMATHRAANGKSYVYIVAFANEVIDYCQIDNSTGNFDVCNLATTDFDSGSLLTGIAFYGASDGDDHVYIVNRGVGSNKVIYYCSLLSDGDFDSCTKATNTENTFSIPGSIAFQTTVTGSAYAYVTDSADEALYYCPLSNDGINLDSCSSADITSGDPLVDVNNNALAFY